VTPLLCLHGFTGSPRSFDFLPDAREMPRIVPALVGHAGSSAGAEVQRFEDEVDRLATLAPGGGPLHLVGYSLGARLALGFALRHPARVTRLTLVSAHPGLASEAERAARRTADRAWCELLQRSGTEAFVDAWQCQPLWASQMRVSAEHRAQKRSERLSHTAAGLCRSLRVTGLGEMPHYTPAVAEIQVPVDVLAGALDHKFCELARSLAGHLSRAELELVPHAGHDLLLERPDLITRVIRRGNPT